MLKQLRLLVFDLDYLVFDCAALKGKVLRESLLSCADEIPPDIRLPDAVDAWELHHLHGWRWPRHLEIGLDEDRLEEIADDFRLRQDRLVEAGWGSVFPGISGLLQACREAGLSNVLGAEASRDYLMAVSDRQDLAMLFDAAYCTGEFGMGGAEEMLDEILNRAEALPSETALLGTRPSFFEAARNLDVLSIGCGWGTPDPDALGPVDLQAITLEDAWRAIEAADGIAADRHEA